MDIAQFFLKVFPKEFTSNSSVRRAIKAKALKINDINIDDPFATFYCLKLGNDAIGLLLEYKETIITSFCNLKVVRLKEKFEGWEEAEHE